MTQKPLRTIAVVQGEHAVSHDPEAVFSTVLGSCVAVCLHDPAAAAGGMNHFLLPGQPADRRGRDVERYGVHLMEVLINDLMKAGARRERMQAKVFGGANIVRGLGNIGAANAEFARNFLRHEGIRVVAEDLGGERARRVQFWPASGRARQLYVAPEPKLAAAEAAKAGTLAKGAIPAGDMELFS
jgi:chemotaxis protein CheD